MDKDTIMEFTTQWILTKAGNDIIDYCCDNCHVSFPNRNNLIPINCPCCGKQMINIKVKAERVWVDGYNM